MRRAALAGVAMLAVVIGAPATASAEPFIQTDHGRAGTAWTVLDQPDCDVAGDVTCRLTISLFWRGGQVFEKSDPLGLDVDYPYTCRRPGEHRWTGTVEFSDGRPSITESGRFRVRRCGRWRLDPVTRGTAAATAARLLRREFVSRSRCDPRSAYRRGRAGRWLCLVTHNNTYRECTRRVQLRFVKRTLFSAGDVEDDVYFYHLGRRRCRYF